MSNNMLTVVRIFQKDYERASAETTRKGGGINEDRSHEGQ